MTTLALTKQTKIICIEEICKIKKLKINSSNDIKVLSQKWYDIDDKYKKYISQLCIEYWINKNTKIINTDDLIILEDYVKTRNKYKKHKINITDDYEFEYIEYNDDNIRQENIFKLNLLNIVNKLKKYFPKLSINIFFEKNTWADKEIKLTKAIYKHDVVINIRNNDVGDNGGDGDVDDNQDIENTFEIVLEYFEKIHNRFSDGDKYISTTQTTDDYLVFNEKTDSISEYFEKTIYTLIKFICASTDDKYELSKIMYYKKNLNKKSKRMKNDYFSRVIDYKRNNMFNLEDFYNELKIKNYSFDEFVQFIEDEYEIELDLDDDNNCNSKNFDKLIILLDDNELQSSFIRNYKEIYINVINILNDASDEIIKLMKVIRNKRFDLPIYVKNLLKYHKESLRIK